MTFNQLIKYFQTQTAAATALKVRPHTVCGWQKRGIPKGQQARIQIVSRGKLKAEP